MKTSLQWYTTMNVPNTLDLWHNKQSWGSSHMGRDKFINTETNTRELFSRMFTPLAFNCLCKCDGVIIISMVYGWVWVLIRHHYFRISYETRITAMSYGILQKFYCGIPTSVCLLLPFVLFVVSKSSWVHLPFDIVRFDNTVWMYEYLFTFK